MRYQLVGIFICILFIAGCSSYDIAIYNPGGKVIGTIKVTHVLVDRELDSLYYDHSSGHFEVNKFNAKLAADLLKLLLNP